MRLHFIMVACVAVNGSLLEDVWQLCKDYSRDLLQVLGPLSYVLNTLDDAAYPSSVLHEKSVKRDRENLKKRLGIKIHYSASIKKYTLVESSEFFRLSSNTQLNE